MSSHNPQDGNRRQAPLGNKAHHHNHHGNNQRQAFAVNKAKPTTMFQPYWSEDAVKTGLKSGHLLQGPVRINEKNYENAYVSHPKKDSDIFLCGMAARNRALHGDVVALVIEPKKNWRVFDEFVKHGNSTVSPPGSTTVSPTESPSDNKNNGMTLQDLKVNHPQLYLKIFPKDNLDLETSDDPPQQSDDPRPIHKASAWSVYVQRTAQVVAIVKRVHFRKCVGTLRPPGNKVSQPKYTLFAPTDPKVPRLIIPRECWPQDFHKCPENFASAKFVARIVEWPENGPYANGVLLESLSDLGFVEMHTRELLIVCGVEATGDFPAEVMAELPSEQQAIKPEELVGRADLRDHCIFTIDPPSARDLDDAVHYRPLDDGNVELGVHIADVSHYVRPGTNLDAEASQRATSVYLVDRVIPMLPRALCEHLCTLTPGQDKLAFTVIWTVDPQSGRILNTRFTRSIIRSCAKLSYNDAQMCLENPERDFEGNEHGFSPVEAPYTANQLRDIINNIARITRKWRQGRFTEGALVLNQPKITFHLSEETKAPVGVSLYTLREANWLVEELMLLANISVAEALFRHLPQLAMLRRHEPPDHRTLLKSVQLLKRLGYKVDAKSSGSLQRSLDVIQQRIGLGNQQSTGTMQLLVNVCSKSMQLAKYFCGGEFMDSPEACRHYALNVDYYTHFTSPIRRYPDIVVHRQLAAILPLLEAHNVKSSGTSEAPGVLDESWILGMDYPWVVGQANWSNIMKKAAKEASLKSNELFYSLFVKECGPFEEQCLVFNVLDKSFDVIVVSCGLIKRVYCEQLELENWNVQQNHSAYRGDTNAVVTRGKQPQTNTEVEDDVNNLDQDAAEEVISALAAIGVESEEMAELDDTVEMGSLPPSVGDDGVPAVVGSPLNSLQLTWAKTKHCSHRLPVQEVKCQDLVKCRITCEQVDQKLKMQVLLMRPACTLCSS